MPVHKLQQETKFNQSDVTVIALPLFTCSINMPSSPFIKNDASVEPDGCLCHPVQRPPTTDEVLNYVLIIKKAHSGSFVLQREWKTESRRRSGINQSAGGQRDRRTVAPPWSMLLVKNGLNEAERCVLKIMTLIMEVLSKPSGEMHFMSMSSENFWEDLLNIRLLGAESTSSGDDDDDEGESHWTSHTLPPWDLLGWFLN